MAGSASASRCRMSLTYGIAVRRSAFGSSQKRYCTTAAVFSEENRRKATRTEDPGQKKVDPRMSILKGSLKHVNRKGWTVDALIAAANDLSLPPVVHGMFPRGAAEIAEYWMRRGNENLKEHLSEKTSHSPASSEAEGADAKGNSSSWEEQAKETVISAIQYRLEHTVPFLRSWPQAMALGLYPENVTTTLKLLNEIPDIICFHAGPEGYANDWYARRRQAVLTVYAASELYMLTDYSEGYQDTKDFVRRRIEDSLYVEELAKNSSSSIPGASGVSNMSSATATGIGSIVTAAGSLIFPMASQFLTNVGQVPGGEAVKAKVSDALDGIQQQAERVVDSTGNPQLKAAFTNAQQALKPSLQNNSAGGNDSDTSELAEEEDLLTTINLPDGFSLFGLVSMKADEAVAMLKESNEGIEVIVWPAEESFTPVKKDKVVRLLVNNDDLVVDVWRN